MSDGLADLNSSNAAESHAAVSNKVWKRSAFAIAMLVEVAISFYWFIHTGDTHKAPLRSPFPFNMNTSSHADCRYVLYIMRQMHAWMPASTRIIDRQTKWASETTLFASIWISSFSSLLYSSATLATPRFSSSSLLHCHRKEMMTDRDLLFLPCLAKWHLAVVLIIAVAATKLPTTMTPRIKWCFLNSGNECPANDSSAAVGKTRLF